MTVITAVEDKLETARILGAVYDGIAGRVVPYRQPADIGLVIESFERGAFTASLTERPNVPLLLWHDNQSFPIGVATAWDDRPDGLYAQFRLALTPVAQVAASHAADGLLTGMSVGFVPQQSTWRYAADWDPDLGPDHMDHVTRTQARLVEVSLTPTPAYDSARVTAVEGARADDAGLAHLERALTRHHHLRTEPPTVPPAPTPPTTDDPIADLQQQLDSLAWRVAVLEGSAAANPELTPYQGTEAPALAIGN